MKMGMLPVICRQGWSGGCGMCRHRGYCLKRVPEIESESGQPGLRSDLTKAQSAPIVGSPSGWTGEQALPSSPPDHGDLTHPGNSLLPLLARWGPRTWYLGCIQARWGEGVPLYWLGGGGAAWTASLGLFLPSSRLGTPGPWRTEGLRSHRASDPRAGTLGQSLPDTRPDAEEEASSERWENIPPGSSGPGWGGLGEE